MPRLSSFGFLLFFLIPLTATAAGSFSDLPSSREDSVAVEELKARGIFEGRPDGTFGPDDPVNRAEAITIVVRAVANVKNLPKLDHCFPDVAGEDWYVQTVCYARDLGWVTGYPDGTFQPVRTVTKAEYVKILLNAYGTDMAPLAAFRDPLSGDVRDPDAWYAPFMSYAVASAMTNLDTVGNLNPGAILTRGQVALLTYRFLLEREGERRQDVLAILDNEILAALSAIDTGGADPAAEAVARLRLVFWRANIGMPEEPDLRTTGLVADALDALIESSRLLRTGAPAAALKKAQEAYRFADEADQATGDATPVTDHLRAIAHDLAAEIRG